MHASASFQSQAGPNVVANYTALNAAVQSSLGRPLSASAANVVVPIVAPGTLYGDRLNQLDLRLAKIIRLQQRRVNLNLDLFNALNSSAIIVQNNAFASWQQPQQVIQARFAKISV